ncbi:MAG TPA: zinc ribbon domain-containing protein [Bryobacteraceae bacterium]|nr:zinc ribbon domain-containing protein [Bryobacteraceae bacterium]
MTDRCTCGATLPEDARFCHKCGRPLFADSEVDLSPALETGEVAPPPPPPTEKPKINFHNSVAVRVALMAGGLTSLLISLPLPGYPGLVWKLFILLAGGFFSVFLYKRRTGESLSVRSGARMGWITGIFFSVITLVVIAVDALAPSTEPGLADNFRKAMEANSSAQAEQVRQMLQDPVGIAMMLIFGLMFVFALQTAITVAGGAIGAKVLEKE